MSVIRGRGAPPAAFYPRDIGYAALFKDDDSDYLSWTPGQAASGNTKFYFSKWQKRGKILGANSYIFHAKADANNETYIRFDANNKLEFHSRSGGATDTRLVTTQVFRDPTNHFHFEVFYDSTPGTPDNTVIGIKINGTQVTAFDTETYGAQNDVVQFGQNGVLQTLGASNTPGDYADAYDAEIVYLDNQGTGETGAAKSGVWVPRGARLFLTYGTNGFYLDFASSGDLGKDDSGNGNDFTVNGSPAQVTDTPTNNFPTMNPLSLAIGDDGEPTYTFGNTRIANAAANYKGSRGTFLLPTTGKWYWEILIDGTATSAANFATIGIVQSNHYGGITSSNVHSDTIYASSYEKVWNQTDAVFTNAATAWPDGTIIKIFYDADENKLWFGKNADWFKANGTTGADPGAGTDPTIAVVPLKKPVLPFQIVYQLAVKYGFGAVTLVSGGNADQNGHGDFEYAPPSGGLALCSANIAASLTILDSIDQPPKAIYTKLRTGTGAEATISDVKFDVSAGAIFITKDRTGANHWNVVDTVREATYEVGFSQADAQSQDAQGLKSFTSTGYVLGTSNQYNLNAYLDLVLRTGAAYGLDIVIHEGDGNAFQLINHGLGFEPSMLLTKNIDAADPWAWQHSLVASDYATEYARLPNNDAFQDNNTWWNDAAPSSAQFTVGTVDNVNALNETYVTLVLGDIPGLCKAFVLTGNVNADGPYVALGFTPGIIAMKRAYGAASSPIVKNILSPAYNVNNKALFFDGSNIEQTAYSIDILSQGFKIRDASVTINAADIIVGFAWADHFGPYSNAR